MYIIFARGSVLQSAWKYKPQQMFLLQILELLGFSALSEVYGGHIA